MRPFRDIVRQRILNLTVKSLNDLFPDSMANLFKRSSHRYVTRAKTNLSLALPKAKTNAGKTRFSCMAPTIWNSIPGHLHLITSPKVFNTKCKHLFRQRLETAAELSIERVYLLIVNLISTNLVLIFLLKQFVVIIYILIYNCKYI